MREIEFRGKSINVFNPGEWVYGGYTYCDTYMANYIVKLDDRKKDWIEWFTLVDPETVGQYTGLKDKNGVKIYEGDIVIEWGEKNLIEWNARHAAFVKLILTTGDRLIIMDASDMKTIGNIHDNPELTNSVETINKKDVLK